MLQLLIMIKTTINNSSDFIGKIVLIVSIFIFGLLVGALLFHDTRPRPIVPFVSCTSNCYIKQEITGLVTSILIQKTPFLLPQVVLETDKAIAIKSPVPQSPIHYVIFPKKDIKNIGEITPEDQVYLMDVYAITSILVEKDKLEKYQVITNGPGYQHTSYLHFHLRAEKQK